MTLLKDKGEVMNRIIKVMLRRFAFILLFTTPILNAGGGDSFAGGMAGGMFGGLISGAMSGPSHSKTVVVKESAGVTRNELVALEQAVRSDLTRLYNMIQKNEDTFRGKIRDLEDEIASLKRLLKKNNDGLQLNTM